MQPPLLASTTPTLLNSPNNGAIRRRGSISIKDQVNRSLNRRSLDIKELQASPRMTDSLEQGAFWRQIKNKFSKRTAIDEMHSPSALSLPPQGVGRATSPRLKSPPLCAYKVSLLPLYKHENVDQLPSRPYPASAGLSVNEAQAIESDQRTLACDPLFQVLAPSLPPMPRAALGCEHPACSARQSSDVGNSPRQSPPLVRRSLDSPVNGQRSTSIRKLKKRSNSVKRDSLSAQSYNFIEPEEMAARLNQARLGETRPMLVLDIRPTKAYTASPKRLRSSVNVNIPSLLVKRFRQGKFASFSLKSFVQDGESQRIFAGLCPNGRWQEYAICIVDDEVKDTDYFSTSSGNTAAVLCSALSRKQAEDDDPSQSIYVLRGRLASLLQHAIDLSGDLVYNTSTATIEEPSSKSEVDGPGRIASGRLFNTPGIMSSTQGSFSPETSLPTPRPLVLPDRGEALPLGTLMQAPPQATPASSRKLRPLQLQRLDTSASAKSLQLQPLEPKTPQPLVRPTSSGSFSIEVGLPDPGPAPQLPPTAFVHNGTSAPSRLPAIVMPVENQATPRGGTTFQVSVIIPGFLYLGPEPLREEDVEELESVGIKRILNVATECDTQDRWRGRFEKIASIPMRDSLAETNVQERFEEACMLLDDADLHAKPTFVHCKAGKSRSVTITLAYLIHRNHWPLKRAYAHVLDRRQGVSPNIGFVAELMRFEESELGGRSRGILGTGSTPAHEKVEYFAGHRISAPDGPGLDGKLVEPRTPRSARSDLEGRPTVVRHLSFIASTAMGINPDKPRTRDQRSSTHVSRNRDSMPPGLGFAQYD